MKREHLRHGDTIKRAGYPIPEYVVAQDLKDPVVCDLLDREGFKIVNRVPASAITRVEDLRVGDEVDVGDGLVLAIVSWTGITRAVACTSGYHYLFNAETNPDRTWKWRCLRRVDEIEEAAAVKVTREDLFDEWQHANTKLRETFSIPAPLLAPPVHVEQIVWAGPPSPVRGKVAHMAEQECAAVHLFARAVEEADARAQVAIRRNTREWPFGHRLERTVVGGADRAGGTIEYRFVKDEVK